MSAQARAELGDITARKFHRLTQRLGDEEIDLAAATIEGSQTSPGVGIDMVDVVLGYKGHKFRMHFSVMTLGGK